MSKIMIHLQKSHVILNHQRKLWSWNEILARKSSKLDISSKLIINGLSIFSKSKILDILMDRTLISFNHLIMSHFENDCWRVNLIKSNAKNRIGTCSRILIWSILSGRYQNADFGFKKMRIVFKLMRNFFVKKMRTDRLRPCLKNADLCCLKKCRPTKIDDFWDIVRFQNWNWPSLYLVNLDAYACPFWGPSTFTLDLNLNRIIKDQFQFWNLDSRP